MEPFVAPKVNASKTKLGFNTPQDDYFGIGLIRLLEFRSIYADAPTHQ